MFVLMIFFFLNHASFLKVVDNVLSVKLCEFVMCYVRMSVCILVFDLSFLGDMSTDFSCPGGQARMLVGVGCDQSHYLS